MILDEIDPASRATLEAHGFDADAFEALRRRLADGTLTRPATWFRAWSSRRCRRISCRCRSRAPRASPRPRRPGRRLQAGTVAMVVLAGGMATRFGGGVKAVAEAIDGRSFLEVKLGETRASARRSASRFPVALMTSFATDEAVRAHVPRRGSETRSGSARPLRRASGPTAALFVAATERRRSTARATATCFRRFGPPARWPSCSAAASSTIVVSNVDNLGARLDPVVVGMHVLAGTPLTVEVVEKGDDTGGAPARVDGRPQLLEAMRFPPEFDQARIPVFNTNTSLIEVDALDRARSS